MVGLGAYCLCGGGIGNEVSLVGSWLAMVALFRHRGFVHTLVGFVCSIGISNVVSTFLDQLLSHLGYAAPTIGAVGAGFQVRVARTATTASCVASCASRDVSSSVRVVSFGTGGSDLSLPSRSLCFVLPSLYLRGAQRTTTWRRRLHASLRSDRDDRAARRCAAPKESEGRGVTSRCAPAVALRCADTHI